MGGEMTSYRVYFLNAQGGINRAVELDCSDDDQAQEAARALAAQQPVELWERSRLIGRYDPVS